MTKGKEEVRIHASGNIKSSQNVLIKNLRNNKTSIIINQIAERKGSFQQ